MEAPSLLGFQLVPTFFGFKPTDRPALHENIFNMLWHGEGRWTWDEIYQMPIFLRRFYVKQVNKIIHEKQAAAEEAYTARKSSTPKLPRKPGS
jgi:hypothetical protein